MKRGVLFTGGAGPSADVIRVLVRSKDVICAADSGADTALDAGIRPSYVVGDMDSIRDPSRLKQYSPDSIEISSKEKDFSDTELGLHYLREQGCESLLLIGGGEGRLDHTMGILSLFGGFRPPDFWYTAREEIRILSGELMLEGTPGDSISIFPVGKGPWSIDSNGLQWEITQVPWARGGVSLSNRFQQEQVSLRVGSGRFFVIQPIEKILRYSERES